MLESEATRSALLSGRNLEVVLPLLESVVDQRMALLEDALTGGGGGDSFSGASAALRTSYRAAVHAQIAALSQGGQDAAGEDRNPHCIRVPGPTLASCLFPF